MQGQVGVSWGSSVTGLTYAGSGTVTSTADTFSSECDVVSIKNSFGDEVARYHYNYRSKLDLTVFSSGSTPSSAIPEVGTVITVASDDANIAGQWLVSSSSKSYKQEGILEFSISCTNYSSMVL